MNKIYKVVWNTVRNCYVVGSELISSKSGGHSTSNGKSSSLKVTLTVLALCGMTALGSGVAPAYAADAGTAVASQYVAVLVNDSNNSKRNYRTFDGYSYHKETVSGETYWVRDGYSIKYEENERYPGARKDNIIKAYKTDSYRASSDEGLLKSNQIMIESAGISTLTGVDLDDVSGGTYVGATNSGSTSTPSSFNYMIKDDNGTYIDAGGSNYRTHFAEATKNSDGTYSYNGEVLSNDNLYVISSTERYGTTTNKVGVFLTSSGKVYTGKVFGANNEVLMTTKSDEGTMYSYWGADTPDPNTKLADMTIGQFNQALEKVNNNSKAVAGDTIKEIKTTAKTDGGTIDLVRRGQYNSATGQYEGEYTVGDGITITSHGGTNGKDVKINFSNGTTGFDVAAGSKVEAIKATESTTDITGLKINGETYNIKTGQDYTAGKNITINGNEISATDTDTTYTAGDNVSISDDNVISAKNTTLAAGKAEKKGNSYIVKDTAGNEVTLEDVASESVVNETINTTKTDLTNVINEKDKLNVKYDNEMKNTVTLGGSDAKNLVKVSNLAAGTEEHDAVNFSQLKAVADGEDYVTKGSISGDKLTLTRALGGTVEVTGFQEYVEGKDSYVTNAELDGNILTIEQNNGKGTYQIDLSTFANSFSGTDYRIVPNPAKDSEGVYKPGKDGNIVLTVEDSKTGETTSVTLSDIAGMESVNTLVDQTKTVITNEYNTAINNAKTEVEEKIEEAKVHYFSVNPDNISGAGNYDNDGAVGLDSIAVGAGAYADGRLGAAAFGNRSNADGERALAVGYNAKAEGRDTIAIGYSNNDKGAKGTNSIAIGAQAGADGTQTIFRGKEYSGTWGNATALGAYTEAGAGATAIGASSKARGWNSTAVGNRAEASAANGVALGNASSAMREADAEGSYDYVGYSAGAALSDGERNSTVWHANMGAVSIGNEDFKTGETDEDGNLLHFQYTRQLTGLAAGTADTDAVNVAQLKRSRVELADGLNTSVSYSNDETDGHVIYKVDVNTDGEIKQGDTHIVNGDTVYNALQNVSWTANVNGQAAKTVKKDGTLNFVNGDNISISNEKGDIKISTTGLASSGDLWTAQAGGTDVKAVNQKVNFVGSDHITVTGTDGQIQFEATGLADTDLTNITNNAITKIQNIAKGEDVHIKADTYTVGNDGSVTMTYVDGNGNKVDGTAKITGIAKSDLTNITEGGKKVINNLAKEAVKVVSGMNTTVESSTTTDGPVEYKVNLNEDVNLGDTIYLNGSDGSISAKSGGAQLAFNNSGLTVSQAKNGLTNETRINGAEITVDGGIGNQTTIKGSTARIGSVLVNGGGGTATITGLTNKTTDYTGFANGSGRAATEEQLKEVDSKAVAAKTTVAKGKNITVDEAKAADGSSKYTVGLETDVVLGDNAIKLNGSDGSISAKSGGAQLAFNNSGLTVSQAKNGLTNKTRIDGATITVDGGAGNQTIINGSTAHIGSVLVNGGSGTATISGLTNQTTKYDGFANGSGRAATEEQLKEVDSKAAAAKTTVTNGKNITVDEAKAADGSSTYTVGLETDVVLGDNAIKLNGSDGSISATSGTSSLNFNDKGLSLSNGKDSTVINGGTITVNGGDSVISGTQATFGKIKLNAEGGSTITGLTNTTTDYTGFATAGRAATEEQLKEVAGQAGEAIETAGKGWNLTTNGKESSKTNIKPGGTVDFSSSNDNLLISNAGADLSFSLSDNLDLTKNDSKKGSVKVGENTTLTDGLLRVGTDVSLTASALNVGNSSLTTSALMVGGLTYINSNGLNANNRVISNVAAGILDTDAVNVGQLKSAISGSQVSIKAGDGISVAKTGNQYTINVNIEGVTNNQGKVTVSTGDSTSTESGSESGSSGAKKSQVMDLMYRTESNEVAPETTTDTGKAIQIESIPEDIKLEADDNQAASVVNGETIKIAGDGTNISTAATVTESGSMDTISVSLKPDIQVDSVTINNGGPTINNTGIDMNGKSITNVENITVNNGPTINSSGIDMNSQKITNLADGEIAEGSTDAVNGGQLYNTNQAVIANAENINSLSHSLNKLDSRINRVGAGAAALAALHPLDFDPDNKWDFAAGYGNYAGANAVAIGTYYRPNENTMFSIGGSFGGGENMINAGVSFKLGSGGSGITTSKTVMAKKIKEQDELLKAQDAKMKEQDEKIAKLEALVAQQGEMIQQALGKK